MTISTNSLLMTVLLTGMSIQATHAAPYQYTKNNTTVFVSTGQGNVKANEFVYCQPESGCPVDYKLSQLIWESRNVTMLTTGLSYANKTARINFESQFAVTEGDSVMDDFDWQDIPNLDWTDWSHHDDTSLTEATTLDINMDVNIYEIDSANLLLLVGYREGTWAWESRGGAYIYSSSGTLRDLSGSFTPGQRVITYEQKFSMPYIGFKLETSSGDWRFNLQYDYSSEVKSSAIDHHILRDLVFNDYFERGKMSAYKIGIDYQFNKKFDGFIRYDVQDYKELRGNTSYVDTTTNSAVGGCTNCAGADNRSEVFSIGMLYNF